LGRLKSRKCLHLLGKRGILQKSRTRRVSVTNLPKSGEGIFVEVCKGDWENTLHPKEVGEEPSVSLFLKGHHVMENVKGVRIRKTRWHSDVCGPMTRDQVDIKLPSRHPRVHSRNQLHCTWPLVEFRNQEARRLCFQSLVEFFI
jgi:hypothetical protein